MPAPASVQKATLEKFLAAWENQDVETTIAMWSEDFKQRLLPFSLGTPLHSRLEAEAIFPKLVQSLTDWKLDVKEIVHDAAKSTAAVYATSTANTPLPDDKWTNEYAIFLSISEDGTKISRLEEMVDSAFYQNFFPKLQRHFMEKAASAQG